MASLSLLSRRITQAAMPLVQMGLPVAARNVATISLQSPYKGFKLNSLPSETAETNRDELMHYFKEMNIIRRMETSASEAYRAKLIRGFLHLYSGQEAVCVGMKAAFGPDDELITAYRCHGWAYLMGCSVGSIMGELFGRKSGCQEGKGGSMHMYTKKFYGGNGIVGAQVPVGAGVALALKQLNRNAVCYALYGDGAANQGQVFEAYNIAKLWKLPVIFVCENNKYGMGTSAERSSASVQYYTRGDYIPGIWVDGMNILAVREATKFAREYALANGPIVMEMETYRYHGHSMSDPDNSYRTRDDIKKVRESNDAIARVRSYLLEHQFADEAELKNIEKDIRNDVMKQIKDCQAAPFPALEDLYTHILKDEKATNVRGCDVLTWYSEK